MFGGTCMMVRKKSFPLKEPVQNKGNRDEYGHTSTVGIGGHMFPLEISGLVSPLDPNLDQ